MACLKFGGPSNSFGSSLAYFLPLLLPVDLVSESGIFLVDFLVPGGISVIDKASLVYSETVFVYEI